MQQDYNPLKKLKKKRINQNLRKVILIKGIKINFDRKLYHAF